MPIAIRIALPPDLLGALGLKFAIVEDEEQTARIRKRFDPSEKSKREILPMGSIAITPDLAAALFKNHLTRISPLGNKARSEKLSPKRRSQIARKAIKTRWKNVRNKPSMGSF